MIEVILPLAALAAAALGLLVLYRPAYIVVIFGLALPLGGRDLPGGLSISIALSIAVIAISMVVRLQRGLLPLPRSWLSLMAILWTLGIVFGTVLSPDVFKAATFGAWQIVALLFAICWAELAGRPQTFRAGVAATLIGGGIVALTGPLMAGGSLEASYGGTVVNNRPVGVLGQPNEYGLFCMLLLLLGIGIATGTRGWLRWLALTAGLAALVGLLMSLSRSSWTGTVVGIAALVYLMPQFRRVLALSLTILLLFITMIIIIPTPIPVVSIVTSRALTFTGTVENPYDRRAEYRAEGIRQWNESPIFGQGPNTFNGISKGVNSVARPDGAEHPHVSLLTIGTEQGLVGVAAVVGVAGAIALAARTARRPLIAVHTANVERVRAGGPRRGGALAPLSAVVIVTCTAALVGFLMQGIGDFAIRNPLSRTNLFLIIGWVFAGQRLLEAEIRQRRMHAPPAASVAGK